MRTTKKPSNLPLYVHYFRFFRGVLVLLTPFCLWLLPADYFDTGQSVCLSVRWFGITCWGCGLTRSIMHLLHGDLEASIAYHPLGGLLFLLLGYVGFHWLRQAAKSWHFLFH